jgi:hypothetical protein
MAKEGYERMDGIKILDAYNDFEMRKFRHICQPHFFANNVATVLDYGAGGSDWDRPDFDPVTRNSAKQFFNVDQVYEFEPARDKLMKTKADCVVCMDVLEHIFISDVGKIVDELFNLSNKLLIVNVACYEANALLPNGENAHITVRTPDWWKGVFDVISLNHKDIEVLLICSYDFISGVVYEKFKGTDWEQSETFVSTIKCKTFQPS